MIDRRRTMLGLGAATLPSWPVAADAAGLAFAVSRNGSPMGRHALTFNRDRDTLDVDIAIDLAVKFGPIPLYRYRHRNRERWRAGALQGFSSLTEDNGTSHEVGTKLQGEELVAISGGGRWAFPVEAFATTYWHRSFLDRPLWINSQTGEPAECMVAPMGRERIEASVGSIEADRFRVTGALTLDIWYEGDFWAGLLFAAPGGSEIRYRRDAAAGLEIATLS